MAGHERRTPVLFGRSTWAEASRVADVLRKETVGGALILAAAVVAMVWVNSPWSESYLALRSYEWGPSALHLRLPLASWAADGLLAIFFFVAGLEVKREFVAGDLRDPRRALVPVAATLGGVVVPAVLYLSVTGLAGAGGSRGWAIPTATDIAFALAILAVVGQYLPPALRTFLLTLAVIDDLLAIAIIAVLYTADLALVPLLAALVPLGVFAFLVRRGLRCWYLLVPFAAFTWALVHASGVHATVAGVLLAFTVPVRAPGRSPGRGPAELMERGLRPVSAGLAVPLFALFSAGVVVGGIDGLGAAFADPVVVGVVVGLVVGKPLGIMGATWLTCRFTGSRLDRDLAWIDVLGMSILAGVGFTVSLLVGELAFGLGTVRDDHVKVAVLAGSLTAAAIATAVLRRRNGIYRRIRELEIIDRDANGVPDVYEQVTADVIGRPAVEASGGIRSS